MIPYWFFLKGLWGVALGVVAERIASALVLFLMCTVAVWLVGAFFL